MINVAGMRAANQKQGSSSNRRQVVAVSSKRASTDSCILGEQGGVAADA
jgi:hypothetical protein